MYLKALQNVTLAADISRWLAIDEGLGTRCDVVVTLAIIGLLHGLLPDGTVLLAKPILI